MHPETIQVTSSSCLGRNSGPLFNSEKAWKVLADIKIVSSLEKYLVWVISRARQCRHGWGALRDPSEIRHERGKDTSIL